MPGTYCCVGSCRNTYNANKSNVSFHVFPKDPLLLKVWVEFCDRGEHWAPKQSARICSVHFKNEDFEISHRYSKELLNINPKRKLNKFAVPCYKESLDEGDNVVEEIILKYSDSDEEQHKYEVVDINKIKRESLTDDSETYKDSFAEIETLREEIANLKRKTEEQEETICKMKLLNESLARDLHNERHRNLYYKNKVNLLENERTRAVSQRSCVGSAQDQIVLIVTNEESDKLS